MVTIRPMALDDLARVMVIERLSFALPWSENSFRKELTENDQAHFFVAVGEAQVLGFSGYWYIVDECHISTLAVHPQWRRQGIGELLLVAMLEHAEALGAVLATLEVRRSNVAAQALYRKYGFEVTGLRKRYYRDNDEDALIMTARPITFLNNAGIKDSPR